ncbi:MAG: CapA family protein [Planctomycetota bacterium]
MNSDESICFLGDFACPSGLADRLHGWKIPDCAASVINLEGAFPSEGFEAISGSEPLLYNDREALPILQSWKVRVASLANNHLLDANSRPSETRRLLRDVGIQSCGGGDDSTEASEPATIEVAQEQILVFSFGWPVIGCKAATPASPGVNPLEEETILRTIETTKDQNPKAKIILLLHWDYELELYPLPGQRRLSRNAISAGVDLIIGHHPHCVQGIEIFGGRPVIYSIGNWFIPQGRWFGSPVRYPDFAMRQMAVVWNVTTGQADCHWFDFDPDSISLTHHQTLSAHSASNDRNITPFSGMSDTEYRSWFKEQRRQKRLLPIYDSFVDGFRNRSLDAWVRLRHQAVKARSLLRLLKTRRGNESRTP